jgi:glucose-1-phosphate thymidylyltransferase
MASREVIGLIPAGGRGTRIAPLPCSKEVYPIGWQTPEGKNGKRPKVACHYLLEKMRAAGITKTFIVLREGKWDIPAYLGSGGMLDMQLAYLVASLPFGPPYTIDEAYPFIQEVVVAFGFPDILFESDSAFTELLRRQETSGADVVLGLFPGDQPEKMDMVDLDDHGRVREIVIKPERTTLQFSWDIAVWTPAFTKFLHDYLKVCKASAEMGAELSVGEVIREAVRNKLRVEAVAISDKPYLDIGTPEGLMKALTQFSQRA